MAVAILGLGLSLLSPAGSASASGPLGMPRPDRAGLPTLTSVHAEHVGNVDRVTFRFKNGLPQSIRANYVRTMHEPGSGLPVRVAGAKVLMMLFYGAIDHTRGRKTFALPNVITAVAGADTHGGGAIFGLGVQKRTSYTITQLTHPFRVVFDVSAGFPTTMRSVWLISTAPSGPGNPPYFVPRERPIRSDAPAAAALHALFAGPTQQEGAAGVELVRSHAWGFTGLRIANGIARLRLTHGCKSRGSTITVADEIIPTLRELPTVEWVKIYGPDGVTVQPQGQVDSIPACLEPVEATPLSTSNRPQAS